MKKKWLTTVVLALCLALVASLFTACGKKKVKIELSQTTLELTVGESETLTATTSNGSEVEWSTSDAKVATVSSRGGVTAQGAGTATITAKSGKSTATCTVTVTEKVVITFAFTVDGTAATEATVNRDGTVQLGATASDGSTITSWESQDESIASVSDTGLVSGLFDGETNIIVKTATGQGSITVTVVDTETDKYAIGTDKNTGKWWYAINGDGGRTHELTRAEYRKGVVSFAYTGSCNWSAGDVQLGWVNSEVEAGWHSLTLKINSSAALTAYVNGTTVKLAEGNNDIEVAYEQVVGQNSILIELAVGVNEANIVVSDFVWGAFTPVTLEMPTFTRDGNNITISTADVKGIAAYQVGLFEANGTRPVFTQDFAAASGTLDTSKCEHDGEFIIRVRTVGNPGYTTSAWSVGDTEKVTVANGNITYSVEFAGESDAKKEEHAGKWVYWAGDGSSVETVEYVNGKVTVTTKQIGWAFYGIQLFRYYSEYSVGDNVKITMTVKASHTGSITVRGNAFKFEADTPRTIEIFTTQAGGDTATIGIQLGVNNGGTDFPAFAPGEDELTVEFYDVSLDTYDPIKLESATIAIDSENAFTITDDDNADKTVDGYRIEIFNSTDTDPVKTQTVTAKTGNLDVATLGAGTFTAKVTTLGHGQYVDGDVSDASDAFTVTALTAPSITVDKDNNYAYEITDSNPADYVSGYEIYVGTKKFPVTTTTGNIDISSITTGTYDVKVVVLASKKYANAESATVSVEITNEAGVTYDLYICADEDEYIGNSAQSGKFVLWKQDYLTASGNYSNGKVTVELGAKNGGEAYDFQMFYRDPDVNVGQQYTMTMKIKSTVGGTFTVSGKEVTLEADTVYEYSHTKTQNNAQYDRSTISVQFNQLSGCTVEFYDIVITPAA